MRTYEIRIEGMGCMHCVTKVQKALTEAGIAVESCVVGSAVINTALETDALNAAAREAIENVGFDVIAIEEKRA